MIQCVAEVVAFKSLRVFCIGLRFLHQEQTSIDCAGLLFVPPECGVATPNGDQVYIQVIGKIMKIWPLLYVKINVKFAIV